MKSYLFIQLHRRNCSVTDRQPEREGRKIIGLNAPRAFLSCDCADFQSRPTYYLPARMWLCECVCSMQMMASIENLDYVPSTLTALSCDSRIWSTSNSVQDIRFQLNELLSVQRHSINHSHFFLCVCVFEIFLFGLLFPKSMRMSCVVARCVFSSSVCLSVSSSFTAECHESITNHLFIQSTLFRCRRMHTRYSPMAAAAAAAAASRPPYTGPRSARRSNTYHLWKMICENSTSNKSFFFHCRIQFPHSTLAHTSLFRRLFVLLMRRSGSVRTARRNSIAVIQFIFKIIYEIFFQFDISFLSPGLHRVCGCLFCVWQMCSVFPIPAKLKS